MKVLSYLFTVNGKPLFLPDENFEMTFSDQESSDSGQDEGGTIHRIIVKYKAGKWTFSYSAITEEEKNYMESVFPDEPDFEFGHPDRKDSSMLATCRAYRSSYSIAWKNARTGLWKNYKFVISEC